MINGTFRYRCLHINTWYQDCTVLKSVYYTISIYNCTNSWHYTLFQQKTALKWPNTSQKYTSDTFYGCFYIRSKEIALINEESVIIK